MRKLILLLLALFVIPTAFGLGISPADTRLSFTPGLDKVFTLRILNEEHQASQLSLELSGELAQYMQISQDKINVSENQASLEVVVSIKLPNAMEVGRKEGKITVVRDIPGAGISSRLAISHRVILDVPQEYGRVTALLNATPGLLIAQIRNPKETPASEVGFSIIVADGNNTLARFSQEGIELPAVSSRNIRIPLSSDKEGEFSADFSLTYMDEKYPEHKILMIGKPQPELSAETKNLLIGKVNPFKVEIKNNWNKNYVSRIQTKVIKDGRELSSRTSEDFTLPRYGSASLSLFMDATTLQPGGYTVQLQLFFGDSSTSFSIPIVLGIEKHVTPTKIELPVAPIIGCFVVFAVSVALILLLRKKYKH